MARRTQDDDDNDFDPREYGWTTEEWEELKEIYDMDDDELIEAYPELTDFVGELEELDYLNELDDLTDDDDFYGG